MRGWMISSYAAGACHAANEALNPWFHFISIVFVSSLFLHTAILAQSHGIPRVIRGLVGQGTAAFMHVWALFAFGVSIAEPS